MQTHPNLVGIKGRRLDWSSPRSPADDTDKDETYLPDVGSSSPDEDDHAKIHTKMPRVQLSKRNIVRGSRAGVPRNTTSTTRPQKPCPIVGCPSMNANMRKHFRSCHKELTAAEMDELIRGQVRRRRTSTRRQQNVDLAAAADSARTTAAPEFRTENSGVLKNQAYVESGRPCRVRGEAQGAQFQTVPR